ncbi:hypothetical protein SAMN05443245_5617 [Paraburkholderia fungorum]|uniref:PAAR motif-containing protein n=1 Tax=Paraburkholderia fungorum TaxID=134537 RepID=A0A1H1ISV4_9BURK|nr:hypothetical protein [Paraburkholderia fungorum]SDR40801.1 hypothetical protein SAMN05443245_5617 [Paraburkholderia fungorum]
MSDRLAADGDRTSTGGEVTGHSGIYNEVGKMHAHKENLATCGNWKGGWPIHGIVSGWMDDDYPMVIDGDRVLSPCGKNLVVASSASNAFYSEGRGAAQAECPPEFLKTDRYDEQFTLVDANETPLPDTYDTARRPSGELRLAQPIHGTNWTLSNGIGSINQELSCSQTGRPMPDALATALTNTNPNSSVSAQTERLSKPWKLSDDGVAFMAVCESGVMNGTYMGLPVIDGMILKVYLDSKGFPTVGFGHKVIPSDHLHVGDTISVERA